MKKGYVYKLSGGGKFYIGSTSLTPEMRVEEHKSCSSRPNSQRQPVYRHFREIGWENVKVETLREVEYKLKRDLLQYEREEYDKVANDENCLNVNRPLITKSELKEQVKKNSTRWQQEHKEHCNENLKEWRKHNPAKVKEQRERRKEKSSQEHREWYQNNKERKAEQVRAWRLANPEKYAEQRKRSIEKNNEKRRKARELKNNLDDNTNQNA